MNSGGIWYISEIAAWVWYTMFEDWKKGSVSGCLEATYFMFGVYDINSVVTEGEIRQQIYADNI